MRFLFFIFISFLSLHAYVYYAKAEPVWKYKISSAVSGQVLFSDELAEGKQGENKVVIHIDDKIDKEDLNTTKIEYENLKEMIKISQKIYEIDKIAYEKIKNLSTYSRAQKDAKLTKMLASKNTLLTQKTNLAKLKLKIATLEDRIKKKNIIISPKYYIYKIYPKNGDFVNFGSPLVEIMDLSKTRLTIFVTYEDLKDIKNSQILINDRVVKYKIDKILKVADSTNLSGYRVEIVTNPPKIFSQLVKIEIKKGKR